MEVHLYCNAAIRCLQWQMSIHQQCLLNQFTWQREIIKQFPFLPCDAMLKRGVWCRPVSVRPSITMVYCIHTAEDIVRLLSRSGSPIILVFLTPAPVHNSKGNPFSRGAKYKGSGKDLHSSTEITVIAEKTPDRAIVTIGSHRRSIEWYHF